MTGAKKTSVLLLYNQTGEDEYEKLKGIDARGSTRKNKGRSR